ncbi:uncharacterized protein LOC126768858 isoform X3 [Nymphalis io]|uniref:uncharacterized protein LOC126768858 isoform X3 n=1 Tax=Inachis io TaxID=171585 RepID=UPI00216885D4|nr:uncharacterized protein LOC126768858 isoform X3 [Nymphalis io]
MPERPKRRKNNKNKRKNNKSNRSDVNKNSTEENKETVLESSSDITTEDINENKTEIFKQDCDKLKTLPCENLPLDIKSKISTLDEIQKCDKTQRKQNNDDDSLILPTYIVETPDKSIKIKPKLDNGMKSKSCDNDDSPTIVEITEDANIQSDNKIHTLVIDNSNAIVTHDESSIEWENVDDFKLPQTELIEGVLSSMTIPLNIAQCEHTKTLSPEEESSLRNYLQTLNLSTNSTSLNVGDIKTEIEQLINREVKYRLRRKGFAEDFIYPRAGTSRSLAVIDEEGSSGSSKTSQRQSYISDKKSDNEELEDEVFEYKKGEDLRNENVDFISKTSSRHLIPQKCIRVDAKLKEPEISEARGDWTVKTVEKLTGAELVYLTDSSSSTSSIYDANDDSSRGEETDTSVRIITPTIEVSDAETMLSNSFLVKKYNNNANEPPEKEINKDDKINMQLINNKNSDDIKKDFSYNEPHSNENSHEIVILSTDNLKTNLFVKALDDEKIHISPEKCDLERIHEEKAKINKKSPNDIDEYDLEIKVLKCELNDAINNLIKEVVSDSENSNECSKDTFKRQDSSSSIDSSQCTAKYNPTHSSLNDVSNLINDEECDNINKENIENNTNVSHVKDVLHCITKKLPLLDNNVNNKNVSPTTLRDICLKKITSLPFGDKILEELAYVSQRLQNTVLASQSKENIPNTTSSRKENNQLPPPIKPRKSSLKISTEEQNKPPLPARNELVYECLSPSQKMLMEKTNTVIEKDEIAPKVEVYFSRADDKDKDIHNELISRNTIEKMPMKSQTGSRLLALLRDTSNSPKLNSSPVPNINLKTPKVKENTESYSKRLLEEIDTTEIPTTNKHYPPILSDISTKCGASRRSNNMSSYCYESDSGIRENSFHTLHNNKKYFHYSTGNLSKEIESDITSIQNMHRYCTDLRDQKNENIRPRRPSLPKDLCDQQMEYICQKEKEVDAEIRRLEQEKYKKINKGPRAPMFLDKESCYDQKFETKNNTYSKKYVSMHQTPTCPERRKISSLFSSSEEELLREKMYSEYVNQMAEREQRKQQKVIKITQTPIHSYATSKSMPALETFNSMNNRIEEEFISKAKERWCKLGIEDPKTDEERDKGFNVYREPKIIEHKIKVIESGEEKDVRKLPNHMQEFVRFTVNDKDDEKGCTETVMIAPTFKARSSSPAIWRPGAPAGGVTPNAESPNAPPPPPPPVWSPSSNTTSPQTPRKTFRPVHFEDTPPPRRKFGSSDQNGCTSGSESEGRLRTSLSAPATGLNTLGSSSTSRLPRAQNPTVTLLQKAREGQISRGLSNYQQEKDPRLPRDRPSPPKGDPVHALRKEYASEAEGDRGDYERSQKMTDVKKKIEGIGPTTKDGMPVALRSEVKDPSRWYKKMYDTIHKNKYDGELQRPNSNRSQYAYFDPRSGYLSEPEGGLSRLASSTWSDAYDSDVTSGPRRRTASVQEDRRFDDVSSYVANNKYSTLASGRARQEVYKSQPGRIENYVPGKSSVIDKEAKQWWDEVMDIFDGQNESSTLSQSQASPKEKKDLTSAILSKSNMARALKESGYESDSTLIFRRREDTEAPLSPAERRAAYKDLQAGGEPPLRGFRSPAPPRQETDSAPEPPRRASHGSYSDSESPSRRYVESDVNIHYRCPVRHDPLPLVPERELARQQAEHMKRLYREQKRNKYLQENDIRAADIEAFDASIKELQDMQNRRHQDNFMPSQKTVVPLNRYDEAEKIIARALYTFNGQTARELSFRKGDVINVRKQIDSNWYEGEVHGKIGLFPYNYVELLKGDGVQTLKKSAVVEGRARAKFDFIAQTNLELPLKKGEVVVLTRRIDHNWWEGRNGSKTGIFPDSYVTILQEPTQGKPEPYPTLNTGKPVASPAAHGLLNGTDKRSMGAHRYTPQPNSPALANAPPATQPLAGYITKSSQSLSASDRGYGPPTGAGVDLNNTEPLYVDTNAEAIPYRAMYKYRPQNPDELELNEGDTVYVLEKCDDGWYVGSSQRTGRFGTFPGNYVERI